jgi:hypothetical protein
LLVDLSQPYSHGMFSQKLFPPVRVERCVRIEERGVNVTCISAAVHAGTHIDAPCHFVAGGRSIEQLDLGEVSGPAVARALAAGGLERSAATSYSCAPVGTPTSTAITSAITTIPICRPRPRAGLSSAV